MVEGDKIQIETVVIQCGSRNAMKYTPSGGAVHVAMTAMRNTPECVEDTGLAYRKITCRISSTGSIASRTADRGPEKGWVGLSFVGVDRGSAHRGTIEGRVSWVPGTSVSHHVARRRANPPAPELQPAGSDSAELNS